MEDQLVTITISGISAAGLGALAMRFMPMLLSSRKRNSILPREVTDIKAQVAENRLSIVHLTENTNRLAALSEKQFDKIDSLGDKLDRTNNALMKLYGRVEEALRNR